MEAAGLGWLNVNVDGSYIAETGQASVGVVIWDHTGQAVLAAGKYLQNCCDAQSLKLWLPEREPV
jgi:hypothetical protein